jgi:hypothetical protein
MVHVARSRLVVVSALVSLGGFVLVVMVHCGTAGCGPARGGGVGGADLARHAARFSIYGHSARPMSPGATVPLNLHLRNPNGFRLLAAHLRVRLRRVDAPRADAAHRCSFRDFIVDQPPRHLKVTLRPHRTTSLRRQHLSRAAWPHIKMRNRPVNQDGCKGASVKLHYTATGRRVGR